MAVLCGVSRLTEEREVGLRLKGQNGIMRKKFSALQSDIEAQKEEIQSLFDEKRELYQTIANLEKDILGAVPTQAGVRLVEMQSVAVCRSEEGRQRTRRDHQ